jgi:hypothetical protein
MLPDDQHRTKLPSNPSHKIHKLKSPAGTSSPGEYERSKAVTGSEDPVQPEGLFGRGLCLGRAAVKRIILTELAD